MQHSFISKQNDITTPVEDKQGSQNIFRLVLKIVVIWFSFLIIVQGQIVPPADSVNKLKTKILIASEPDYPPYCIVDQNGKADGFAIELFKESAKAVGIEVEVKIGVWSQIKQDLAEGRIDALPLVGRTPERESKFDFTFSYLTLHGAVFVREGTTNIRTQSDLKNKSIIVMKGDNAEEFVRRENISNYIFTTNTFREAFEQLASGEYDALITQRVTGLKLIESLNIKSVIALDIQFPNYSQDFCFAVKKGNLKLLSRLNEGLSIVIANRKYDQIHEEWFGPAIKERVSFNDILEIVVYTVIPLLFILSIVFIVVLRLQVKKRTKSLEVEISERKQAEIIIQDQNEQLQAHNITKDKIFSIIAHDLKNPFQSIKGALKLLLSNEEPLEEEDKNSLLNNILSTSEKTYFLLENLLLWSRQQMGKMDFNPERIKLIEAVLTSVDLSKHLASLKNITLINKVEEGIYLSADRNMLETVIRNLLGNAIKFTNENGIIEISSKSINEIIEVVVADDGVGIEEKNIDKLFQIEQSFSIHGTNSETGTGLGLMLCKEFIEKHGGKIWVESEVGKGTAIHFTIPNSSGHNPSAVM
ncbi:hypothetical protein APF79_06850 [bacterium BRH_c32]|nr:MAG: hypothetical protein APF79_06850 [bacterium BRH_c32]